jgi:hypothetical protein
MNASATGFEFFASKSLRAHLLRGLAAAALIITAFRFDHVSPWLSAGATLGALVLLRGCPMCWTAGLIETWRNRKAGGTCRTGRCPM